MGTVVLLSSAKRRDVIVTITYKPKILKYFRHVNYYYYCPIYASEFFKVIVMKRSMADINSQQIIEYTKSQNGSILKTFNEDR